MIQRTASLLFLFITIGIMTACAVPKEPGLISHSEMMPPPDRAQSGVVHKEQQPSPPQMPEETPVPSFDAPWYRQRNDELRAQIRQNDPKMPEEAVELEVLQMFIDPDRPMIALTFDDGPVPGVTDKILDVLKQYNVRATFFVCGWRLEKEENRELLRKIAAQGCEIGNHTWSHRKLLGQNYVSVRYEINNTNDVIFDTTGIHPRCFRPPGGGNTFEAGSVTRDDGMEIILWSQSGNVHETDPQKIAQNVEQQIVDGKKLHSGDVVLLHDTHESMVEAVKIIVPKLIEEGYQLVTVWELLNCMEDEVVPGDTYWNR